MPARWAESTSPSARVDGGASVVSWAGTHSAGTELTLRFGAPGGLGLQQGFTPDIVLGTDGGATNGSTAAPVAVTGGLASHLAFVEVRTGATTIARGQVLPRPSGYATVQLPLADGGVAGGGHFVIPIDGGVPIAGRSSYLIDFPGLDAVDSAVVRQGGAGGTGPLILTLQLAQGVGQATRAVGFFDAASLAVANTDGGVYVEARDDANDAGFRGQVVIHQ
jgi:hypothetical protein